MNFGCAYSGALVVAIMLASIVVSASDQEMASAFTLENPSKKKITVSFPRAKPLLLTLGDQNGAKQIKGWVQPIKKEFGDALDVIGVANLEAIPSLMRGAARLMFKKTEGVLLLDWTGKVNQQYATRKGTANILVIEPGGAIALRFKGPVNDERLERALAVIAELVEDEGSP